ncbi:UvrD-helicase domain-containing protein [Thiorhodococcus mannitoliphagus]|uniref:UvrD-helicase domain-containing protein n=1 Tax=Thiorhodococcus mannitoliphagus TaxID=329406 RepID=A0A6P1DW73_9GAMM|nr:UvrD-helicase domain-containing protein [Thiorhodococcus mannitoliphagus]NEX19875.1 UvrD-helicase domain-containing protein [Thiorhodococcus mannitoliphagus]
MAQLMWRRELLTQLTKVPAKVKKKLAELHRKFEEDSTQASLHLKPVQGARDPKVRSARVGDDYRAIIIAPEQGDTYLLVHVDHHDEAYQWCQSKQFEAHGALGTLQIFDVEEIARAVAIPEESSAAASAAVDTEGFSAAYPLDSLDDEALFTAGIPKALIPAVRAVRTDDAFEQLAEYLPPEAAQVLYGVVAGMSLDQALEEMLGALETAPVKPAGPGDFSHLAQAANLDLVLVAGEEHLKEILSEDIEAWRIFLHPYQRKLVQWDVKGPMKIHGAAGTGKTVALMHRAVWLAKQTADQDRVLLTTYTTNLSVTIKALLERLAPKAHQGIEVTNLHQLARTIALRCGWRGKVAEDADLEALWEQVLSQESDLAAEFNQDFIRSEFAEIVDPMGIDSEDAYLTTVRSGRPRIGRAQRKLLWRLFARMQREQAKRNLLTFEGVVHQARLAVEQGQFPRYRHVLVDELQDFGLEALRLIRALSPIDEGLANPLCVVGDGHQRLYNRTPVPVGRAGIEVRGRSRRLKINYRTSEQIRRWAQGLLAGVEVDDLDGGSADTTGDRSVFRGPDPQVLTVDSPAAAGGAVVDWVRHLLDCGFGTHEICITPTEGAVINALETAGIPTLELLPRQRDPGQDEPGVRYGTKKRIKGLEFRAVVLLYRDTDAEDARERFANYVAATRARELLLVLRT